MLFTKAGSGMSLFACRHSARSTALTTTLLALLFCCEALCAEPTKERFTAIITNSHLMIIGGQKSTNCQLSLDGDIMLNIHVKNFDFEQVSPAVYHLRNKIWKEFFWRIDTDSRKVTRVQGGVFGMQGGTDTPIDTIRVYSAFFSEELQKTQQYPKFTIRLEFQHIDIEYDSAAGAGKLSAEGDDLMADTEWDIRNVEKRTYEIRFKRPTRVPLFIKIDSKNGMAHSVMDDSDAKFIVKPSTLLPWVVRSVVTGPVAAGSEIKDDIDMADWKATWPESIVTSDWFESEKKLYLNLLRKDSYDVLVVPFQVQGYAVDRIGRSLMTRYLVHRIERTTDAKVPSPTLVAKALGELSRRMNDDEVYRLANVLNVKTLIRGYVGHNRDEKMVVTILVQSRDSQGRFTSVTPAVTLAWKDIPFSDERLPSEAFSGMLDEVMTKLPLTQTRKTAAAFYEKEKTLPVPDGLPDLTRNTPRNPVQSAYHLQLLGAMYPEANEALESLFERSLVALADVSPGSPDYPLLKARAYFYLYRRPAALAALRSASGIEGDALRALLDGNLPELGKLASSIPEPLPRLLAQMAYMDLHWVYLGRAVDQNTYDAIVHDIPVWKDIDIRRLNTKASWPIQSNYMVKSLLDKLLPVPRFTVEDIAMNRIALAQGGDIYGDIDLSVYLHRRKLLENQGSDFIENESGHPVKRDMLDLLSAIGETNLLTQLRSTYRAEKFALLDRYDAIYRGHPDMTHERENALWEISFSKQGQVRENLQKQAGDLNRNVCGWYQGQSSNSLSRPICGGYNGDYPGRWSYQTGGGDRDVKGYDHYAKKTFSEAAKPVQYALKNFDVALKYTSRIFKTFAEYHKYLLDNRLLSDAEKLAELNKHRFIGHPSRSTYFAELRERAGDIGSAIKLYTEAIAALPNEWGPYQNLGAIYIKKGDYRKASELFMRYPLFKEGAVKTRAESINTASLSSQAYDAADMLFWHGAIMESIPLFEISAGYQSGTMRGSLSEVRLAQLKEDYLQVARGHREMAKQYNRAWDYIDYAALLHAMGFSEEAWSLFSSREMIKELGSSVEVPFVGHRVQGKSDEEQRQWFLQQDLASVPTIPAQKYLLLSHLIDRDPAEGLPGIIADVERKLMAARVPLNIKTGQERQGWETPRDPSKKVRSWAVWFADAYTNLKRQRYGIAYDIFKGSGESEASNSYLDKSNAHLLPYGAWSAVKSGSAAEIEAFLRTYKEKNGDIYYYHLSQAYLAGGRKDHTTAAAQLKSAQATLPGNGFSRSFLDWYQLVEACEWLYADTGRTEYRDLAVKYAKICQVLRPLYGWTYAVEAKYTSSESARTRALALALYLDKRSERVSTFTDQEKQKALKWLELHNPFRPLSPQQERKDI